MKYFNVIVKNKSKGADKLFLYKSEDDNLDVGDRVLVPFGKSDKLVEAYLAEKFDDLYSFKTSEIDNNLNFDEIKSIDSLIEKKYILKDLMKLCLWMKRQYLSSYLDIITLFFPSGKKPKRKENEKLKRTIKVYRNFNEDNISLTSEQEKILNDIESSLDLNDTKNNKILLEGVTASGKSEIYIQACKKVLEKGKSVIVVVPEIILTKQLVEKFKKRFSNIEDKIAIMHSSLKNRELHEQWDKIKNNEARLVIGSRMSLFTPLENLGLIILDEEHSQSYKSDRSPKYDGVDIATILADIRGASLILGSATPSICALKRAEDGIYRHLKLNKKYNDSGANEIHLVDMREELKAGNKTVFSRALYDSISESINNKEQVLLILSGSSNKFVSCRSCGSVIRCQKCNVAMKVINNQEKLKCGYCGYSKDMVKACSNCNSNMIKTFGIDVDTFKEEVKKFFPEAILDSVEWKDSSNIKELSEKIENFERGKIDILISTQIFSRGLDFENITTVGIVALDSISNSFDFRGGEKTFQLIVHGGGRAGRGKKRGKVIIQTYKPDFYAIEYAIKNDVNGFYHKEKSFRKMMGYYPFGNLLQINITGKNLRETERQYYEFLKKIKNTIKEDKIVGKQFLNSKEDDMYKFHILLKVDDEDMNKIKEIIYNFDKERGKERYIVHISIDINPKRVWRN